MGVFNCPDCGGIVSEHASTCPNCGCPFNRGGEPSSRKISITRKKSFNGAARKFNIVIDGTICAILSNGESTTMEIDGNNRHTICVNLHQAFDKIGGAPRMDSSSAPSGIIEIAAGASPLKFETTGGIHCKLYQV